MALPAFHDHLPSTSTRLMMPGVLWTVGVFVIAITHLVSKVMAGWSTPGGWSGLTQSHAARLSALSRR